MNALRALFLLTICVLASRGADVSPLVPEMLAACLAKVRPAGERVEFYTGVNPFYLRGDFDGDGRADYVAQILHPVSDSKATIDSSGLIFCFASGRVDVMGARLGPIPENADPLLLISPSWEALPSDSDEVKSLSASGDVVVMAWEDGSGMIYRDKGDYRWAWIE